MDWQDPSLIDKVAHAALEGRYEDMPMSFLFPSAAVRAAFDAAVIKRMAELRAESRESKPMIVDVVHCCRCNREGVLGLVFDVPDRIKAAEVCVDCLRLSVEPWLKPVDLPEGKPVYADFDLRPSCPRCGSKDHFDPEGCPGKQK